MKSNLVCSPGLLASTLALSETRDAEAIARLVTYSKLLDRWSKVQRLVGWRKASLLATEGLADAWTLGAVVDAYPDDWILDLGSGAGLPGLVLSIARTHREVHLVEPRRKRVSFLREVRRELGLENLTVHHGREEDVRAVFTDRSGPLLFARAFRPPEQLLTCASAWRARACVLSLGIDRRVELGDWRVVDEVEGRPQDRKRHCVLEPPPTDAT
jgi:16S rRNA (guanine(527)-N(7))-methyltransferase RsmG